MKQKLRLGDCYALIKHTRKLYTIRYISLLAVLTIMCLYAQAQAPASGVAAPAALGSDSIKPLQVGDTIPEWLWHLPLQVQNHPDGREVISLNNYRGKLIILDFWATWCTVCIKDFPKKLEIARHMDRPTVLLPISSEPKDQLLAYQRRQQDIGNLTFASVIEDTILRKCFPHRFIPHYVIILPNGHVAAFLAANYLTKENLSDLANDVEIDLPMKIDYQYAKGELALQHVLNELTTQQVLQSTTITDTVRGLGYASGNRIVGDVRRFYFYNRPVVSILEFAFDTRLKGSALGELNTLPDTLVKRTICYELAVPKDTPVTKVRDMIAQDIGRFLHCHIRFSNGAIIINQYQPLNLYP